MSDLIADSSPSPSLRNEVCTDDILDPVWGAEAIGSAIGRTKRQAFHLLERGLIPARKIGGRYVASRRTLRAFFESAEGTA